MLSTEQSSQVKLAKKNFIKEIIFNPIYGVIFLLPFVLGFILYYTEERFSVCILINLFHIPCPLCGMSRAFFQLTHLKFAESISYNLLIVIYAPVFLFFGIVQLCPKKIKEAVLEWWSRRLTLFNILFFLFIGLTIVYGILRVADLYLNFANFREVVPENTILKMLGEGK